MRRLLYLIVFLLASVALNAQKRYELPCKAIVLDISKDFLVRQVGVKEKTGKNDGVQVEEYLASVGLQKGNPYCAAGQYWCFKKAIEKLNIATLYIPIIRSGLANGVYNDGAKRGEISKYIPKENDLIIWKCKNGISGHIERIIKVLDKKGNIETVGFNTGTANPRDGGGVAQKRRNIYYPLGRMAVRGIIGFNSIN